MPSATPQAIRKQISQRNPAPVYLIVGDDHAETSALAADISGLVEDELRAFNLERLYAGEKGVTPASIAQAARTLPMMGDRRVVVVLRAEKLLKPKRRGKGQASAEEDEDADDGGAPVDADALDEYIKRPEPITTLVLVAADVDRSRRLYKTIQANATIVECWGLRGAKDAKVNLWQVAKQAEALVRQAVADAGQQIDARAARLVAERAGADIGTLRGDVGRLLLYTAGKSVIDVKDVQEVVSAETAQDDWAVTTAIQRGNGAEAIRQLGLALDAGSVPYMILGQLAWFVREKLAEVDPRRVPAAVESLFRTDLELKSSAGDPRVLLERLVLELCRG
jgi:DNA polymerase-3 subunit delta